MKWILRKKKEKKTPRLIDDDRHRDWNIYTLECIIIVIIMNMSIVINIGDNNRNDYLIAVKVVIVTIIIDFAIVY